MRARLRTLVPLLLTLAVAGYLAFGEQNGGPSHDASEADGDEPGADKLKVVWLDPVELAPGGALIAHVEGLKGGPLEAEVSTLSGKQRAEILHREGDRVVVQLPADAEPGAAKLRLQQGQQRSKARLFQIRPVPRRDILRDVLGGLALLLLGLRTIGQAFRTYASQRLRTLLARLTERAYGSLGLGAMVGGLTQSTTSGAAILAGLLDARMVSMNGALLMMLGVQLGAAAAGALLPLIATREALWVIAVGMLWSVAAGDRPARAFANLILGCGLLFLGLRLMYAGFQPLVDNPGLLPYLHELGADSVGGTLLCALFGGLLCALLQGPGPVFALVLSLAESSGILGLRAGLAVLAGTALGAVLTTAAVAWPFGPRGRRFTGGHLWLGLVVSAVGLLGLPLWTALADQLVAGDPHTVRYGGRVLMPNVGLHLGVGFGLAQLAGVLLAAPLSAVYVRRRRAADAAIRQVAAEGRRELTLLPILEACERAIAGLEQVTATGERAPTVTVDRAIAEAHKGVAGLLRAGGVGRADMAPAAIASLHLASAVRGGLHVAERALEQGMSPSADDAEALRGLHGLLMEGIAAVRAHVAGEAALRFEDVQAREIRLNALEAQARAPAVGAGADGRSIDYRLWLGELLVAYEGIGNHLYRLAGALMPER